MSNPANLPTDAWDYEIDLTGLAETEVTYIEPGCGVCWPEAAIYHSDLSEGKEDHKLDFEEVPG